MITSGKEIAPPMGAHVYLKSSFLMVKLPILLPFSRRRCLVMVAALLRSVKVFVRVNKFVIFEENFAFPHTNSGRRESWSVQGACKRHSLGVQISMN